LTEETKRLPLVPSPANGDKVKQQLGRWLGYGEEDQKEERALEKQAVPALKPLPKTAKAIAAVMGEIGTIAKGGRNDFHGYNYARMEDLLHQLTPLLGKHGIMITQNLINYSMVETRVLGEYEFVVYVEDEVSPPVRQVGMCQGRDRKGGIDDKALNKTHTAARKYFLLGLFQVPAGDFDDGDADRTTQDKAAPVPGPAQAARAETTEERADRWATAFIDKIGKATSKEGLAKLEAANEPTLQTMYDRHRKVFDRIRAAVERRLNDLAPKPGAPVMPSPQPDPTAAINWAAARLTEVKSQEMLDAFWKQVIEPRENEFNPIDFDLLLAEYRRAEARVSPPREEQPEHDPDTGEFPNYP
jgi:ERF superfamily